MSAIPALNLDVDLELDENGRPSTDPNAVVKFTQQLLYKAVLNKTNNGTFIPDDTVELASLIRDMNATALTTRKLDQEEKAADNSRALVEAFRQFEEMFDGKDLYGVDRLARTADPYANATLPDIVISPTEIVQGEQPLNADDYLDG